MVTTAVCVQLAQLVDSRRPLSRSAGWRLHALAVPQPAGPFRLWPRAAEVVQKQPPVAPVIAKREDSKSDDDEVEAQSQPLGRQQVRSALEHVSNYTNNVVFPRD